MPSIAFPRIAIIGGGLGGLSLLAHLQRLSTRISATLYEKDASFNARAHIGGILDMHHESGQRVLNELGVGWKHLVNPGGEEMRIYDSQGKLLLRNDGERPHPGAEDEHSRPEIDRTALRKHLVDYVAPSNSIRWSHNLSSTRRLSDSTHELTFANGATTTCDLIVGADGAWSRIRPLVSSSKPSFAGITGAEISLAPAAIASSPELQEVAVHVGQGTSMALKGGDALFSQKAGDGRIRTYAWFKGDESFSLPTDDAPAARAALLTRYGSWAPWLRRTISECDPAAIYMRPMYALPVGHKWKSQAGVTLLGDAAHLMRPSGEGANLAMLDGLELAQALAGAMDSGKAWQEVVKGFEKEMCARAEEKAAGAVQLIAKLFDDESPHSLIR